jgi:hypothetical protein
MSGTERETLRAAARAHERARTLAAASIDGDLSPAAADWLKDHLNTCDECALIAEEYRALHAELRALSRPEPPRDLWARTSVALDGVDRSRAHGRTSGLRLVLARNRYLVGTALAAGLAIAIISVSMFSQPLANPNHGSVSSNQIAAVSPSAATVAQAPVAVVDGTSYWVAPSNGVYQIRGGSTQCAGAAGNCTVTNATSTVLGSIASKSAVSVVIAPDVRQAAVWTSSKVVILPLAGSAPQTVSIDLLTPRPAKVSPSAAPTAAATASIEPTATPAATPETTPQGSATFAATAASTILPAESQSVGTAAPASATQPVAILDGYRVVGRAPEFSADGLWVAFSARRSNQTTGSDAFVWRAGWDSAVAVTSSHDDLFAGWLGARILISEFADGQTPAGAVSWVYDPRTGTASRIDRPMLLPVVDPTGRFVVYWSGTVRYDQSSGLWVPGQGDLYFDLWSNLTLTPAQMAGSAGPTPVPTTKPEPSAPAAQPSLTPSEAANSTAPDPIETQGQPAPSPNVGLAADQTAGLPQLLPVTSTPGAVKSWAVRWDTTGRYLAIWVGSGTGDAGVVTLLNVIPGIQLINTSAPLLSKPARSNIQFDTDHFVYTAPGQGGGNGTTYSFDLPSVPPTPATTPAPTPAATPVDQPVATPAPSPTDIANS